MPARVLLGGENPDVGCPLPVQALEMAPVVREQGTAQRVCPGQYVGIGGAAPTIVLHP